jgi:hypothetical protein
MKAGLEARMKRSENETHETGKVKRKPTLLDPESRGPPPEKPGNDVKFSATNFLV